VRHPELLGSRTFADTHSARDVPTGEIVVIKVMHKKLLDESAKRMFYREVEILALIDHPTLLGFRGLGGGSLQTLLNSQRRGQAPSLWNDTQRMINLFGIADGMMILHCQKIIHRDLKPENVILTDNLEPKISEFGFSKFFEAEFRKTF
jgi:serine/threonine protein kinase